MNAEKILSKLKPLIIIILLFSAVFILRAEAAYLPGTSADIRHLFEDQNRLPYFSEMDSYYNYRMTQNYINHGYLGDTIKNGIPWDLHSYYPSGRDAVYPPLIAIITAFAYKIVNSFADVPLNAVAIWLAPFIASLAVIPAYLFVRRITNDYGGITAGLLVGLSPAYFSHTYAGFFDTDMFNMLFPILIVVFFIVSILADDVKSRSIFVSLSAISLFIYSTAWEGWWYMFYLLIGTAVIYFLFSNYLFKIDNAIRLEKFPDKIKWFLDQPALFSLIVFMVITSVLLSFYLGLSGFVDILTRFIGVSQLHTAVQSTAYPNVYLTVAELQVPSIWAVILKVGGILPFLFGILVVPLFLFKLMPEKTKKENAKKVKRTRRMNKPRKVMKTRIIGKKAEDNRTIDPSIMEKKKNYLLYTILFSIWLLTMGFSLTQGSRFIEQFSIPLALGAGVFVGLMVPYFRKHIKSARYCMLACLLMVAFVSYSPITETYSIAASTISPSSVNDSMYNSLTWIRDNTPQNTVLTSWWDFGHLFTAVADRPVTFDGGSQNTPRAYWVGKALTTSDENLSAGILRMLTSSGDQGISTIEAYTKDIGKSVEILDTILPVDKQAAQTILTSQYKLTPEQAQNVLQYTHPDNPTPHELILSSDMIIKAGVWSKFGDWNFQKNTGQSHGYSLGQAVSQQINGNTVITAQNGVIAQINGTKITAYVRYYRGNQIQMLDPHRLIVVQNGNVVMNQVISNESIFSIALIKENNDYLTIIMNKELEDSMFTRLYFENGAGLSKFKLVHRDGGVMVWNVI